MAAYLDTLTADMKAAMKAREQDKLTVLRMIISDIKKKAEAEGELSEEDELAILQRPSRHALTRSTKRRRRGGMRSRHVSSARSR